MLIQSVSYYCIKGCGFIYLLFSEKNISKTHNSEKVDYIESVISLFQQYGWEPSKRTVRSLFHDFDKKIKYGDWTKICLMVFLQNKDKNSVYDRMVLNPQKRDKSIIFKKGSKMF